MPRTPESILEDDEDKLTLGGETEELETEEQDDVESKPAGKTGASKAPTPEEEATELRKQVAIEKARGDREATARRDAETRAEAASSTAGNAVQSQIAAQEQAIKDKKAAEKTNLDSIKSQLKQAKAAGDTESEVDLQDALTDARYRLNAVEWEEKQFATWKESQKNQKTTSGTTASPYTDREQAWIATHPAFNTNKKFARLAKIAAQEAREEGLAQDSAAYFNYIEDALRENNLLATDGEPLSGAGTHKEPAVNTSTAAAPNRSGNGTGVGAPNKNSKYPFVPKGFTIPADWVAAAADQGFDDVREYANMRLEDESKNTGNSR